MWDLSLGHTDSLVVAMGLLPYGMRDLSSLTRAQTDVPCLAGQLLNHWSMRSP